MNKWICDTWIWVIVGPAGYLAPYFGYAPTRKRLREHIETNHLILSAGHKFVRVRVSPPA